MKKLQSFSVAFMYGFVLYIIIVRRFIPIEIGVGIIVSLMVAAVLAVALKLPVKYLNPMRLFWLIVYLPFFIFEMIKANIRIASIVLHPKLPINPSLKKGKTELSSSFGKPLLSSSITLTPGTLTVDVNKDEFSIHCVRSTQSAEQIMALFEKFIKRITE